MLVSAWVFRTQAKSITGSYIEVNPMGRGTNQRRISEYPLTCILPSSLNPLTPEVFPIDE